VHVDMDQFTALSRNAIDIAVRLDANLAKKFKVRRTSYAKRKSRKGMAQRAAVQPSPAH
jgi:hypothetical protein